MPNYVKQIIKFKTEEDFKLIVNKYCNNLDDDCNELDIDDTNGELIFNFNKIQKMPNELNIENSSSGKNGLLYLKDPIAFVFQNKNTKFLKDVLKELTSKDIYDLETYEIINIINENKSNITNNSFDLILGEQYKENVEKYGHADWYDWRIKNWGTKWNSCNTNININELYISFETAWDIAEPIIIKMVLDNNIQEIDLYFADEGCSFCGKTTMSINEDNSINCINFEIKEEFEQNFVDYTFSENLESLENLINY